MSTASPPPASRTPTLRDDNDHDSDLPGASSRRASTPTARPDTKRSTTLDDVGADVDVPGAPKDGADVLVVDWDGPDDPGNPRNWSYRRKWAATLIVSSFTFISPVSSSMVAPAAQQLAHDLGITNTSIIALTVSVFVLGYAFGPLLLGPLSEIYGRSIVLQLANMWYLAWNLGCGFAQNTGQFVAFRFLAGLGGSAPLAIGGGVLADLFAPAQRGQAIAIYSLAPLLGPVVGPVAGAWIAERSTWRWVFWSTTIVDAGVQIAGLFLLQETYPPLLLERRAAKIRQAMAEDPEQAAAGQKGAGEKGQQGAGSKREVRTVFEAQGADRHWKTILAHGLVRPFTLFAHEPIIQVLGLYMAFIYGTLYLFLTTIPAIFGGLYHQSTGIAGLHYIALGLGLSGASQINARLIDRIYVYCTKRFGAPGRPEYRLPSMVPGTILTPIGMLIAGWAAQEGVHWIVTDIGIALVGAGQILNFQSIQTYVIDAFTLHAASALAAVSCLRSLAGFGFPLFAPAMYAALGYGKGDTILAAAAVAIGCPAPFIFWFYGERIRKASRHARS